MKWYLNMKMGKKLVIAFVLVAIIAGIVGIIGYTGIEEVRASQTQIAKDNFPRVESLMLSREEATEVMLGQRGLMMDKMKAQSLRDAQYVYIDEARASLTTEWGIVMGFKQSEEMKALYASANEYLTDFINESDKLDVMAKKKDEMIQGGADYNDIAVMNLDEQTYQQSLLVRENFLKFDDLIAEIIAFNVKLKDDTYDNAELSANQAAMFLIVIIGVAIIVSIALGVLISRMISKPIDEIVGYANNIAQGKLDDKIEVKTKDELGDLQRAFGQILESLNTTMKDINDAAEQVSTGSSQVSDGAQQLSQGSTEQASSIEEITASVTQVAEQTKDNANNANEANRVTLEVKDNASKGDKEMINMLDAMKEINDSSQNISKIIKVIDDIAFQTNLLALNAAVEAARAGQHGKGFAVVAEEVRNLAARSANAAKETTTLIEGSMDKVNVGTKIAQETAKALADIVKGVETATTIVSQISSASNEQAAAIEQLNEGLNQISKVVQNNSATAEESAAASEELSSQAELLKEMVNRFKLATDDSKKEHRKETTVKKEVSKSVPKQIKLDDDGFGKY
ncbi:MAG: methyl-accepting chemotaxis protein [Clostridia bacterium]|nr:methyl-accepting chemotaxis protein [Clostridia bacterium]MDD3093432.1 methyl-accepting chemotaxis protein [Clostridia bacterium]